MGLGPMEMIIVGIIAILLFGNRLPEVAKSIGKGFGEFKKGMSGIEDDLNSASRSSYSSASYNATSRPARAIEDREEATAPKFEPPPAESST
ncbi:MAG: twin-arginine translocase TatA/TatE family subunit [Pirellulales bacterium]